MNSAFPISDVWRKNWFFRMPLAVRCPLLLFLCWSGPIPWCHCHGTLANTPQATSTSWLANHLATQHSAISPFADMHVGWHFHLGLPRSPGDGYKQRVEQEHSRLLAPCSSRDLSLQDVGGFSTPALSLTADTVGRMGMGRSGSSGTSRFFESFAPSLPLPLRFCVMRD